MLLEFKNLCLWVVVAVFYVTSVLTLINTEIFEREILRQRNMIICKVHSSFYKKNVFYMDVCKTVFEKISFVFLKDE